MNEELATIFAALLSDGNIRRDKMLIELRSKDMSLIYHFKRSAKILFNLPDNKFKGNWKNQQVEQKKIHICSTKIARFLLRYGNFRHNPFRVSDGRKIYPIARIPSLVMKDREAGVNFLKMYASCDGCVETTVRYIKRVKIYRISGCVCFACENPTLNQNLYKLLTLLGFRPIRDSKRVRLGKTEDIAKYEREIGFVKGVRTLDTRPTNRFYENKKNDILKLLVHVLVYGIPYKLRKVPQSEENKRKIVGYLKSLLRKIENKEELPRIRMKKRCKRLTKEERNWLLRNRIRVSVKSGRKYAISVLQISEAFEKRFGRKIHWGVIYQYWRKK